MLHKDPKISKPVIKAQLIAQEESEQWMRANSTEAYIDADGFQWQLLIERRQIPEPLEGKKLLHELHISIEASATAQDLLRCGALDAEQDARLLQILGDEAVPYHLKTYTFSDTDFEELKLRFANFQQAFKAELAKKSLLEWKRRVLFSWIEKRLSFAANL